MTSLIIVCLCGLTMVTTRTSKVEDIFESEIDQRFGMQGCRKQCGNRNACVGVKYSHMTMACVLKLNTSSKGNTEPGSDFCVERSVKARSGRIVTVCELHDDLPLKAHRIKYNEMILGLISVPKNVCKVSGKQRNILEPIPDASSACKAKMSLTFLKNGKYSWTVSVTQRENRRSRVIFKFRSTENDKELSKIYLTNFNE